MCAIHIPNIRLVSVSPIKYKRRFYHRDERIGLSDELSVDAHHLQMYGKKRPLTTPSGIIVVSLYLYIQKKPLLKANLKL